MTAPAVRRRCRCARWCCSRCRGRQAWDRGWGADRTSSRLLLVRLKAHPALDGADVHQELLDVLALINRPEPFLRHALADLGPRRRVVVGRSVGSAGHGPQDLARIVELAGLWVRPQVPVVGHVEFRVEPRVPGAGALVAEEGSRVDRVAVGVVAVHLEENLPVAGVVVLQEGERPGGEALQFPPPDGHHPGGGKGLHLLLPRLPVAGGGVEFRQVVAHKRRLEAVGFRLPFAKDEVNELVARVDWKDLPPVLKGVEALNLDLFQEEVSQSGTALVVVDG